MKYKESNYKLAWAFVINVFVCMLFYASTQMPIWIMGAVISALVSNYYYIKWKKERKVEV